MSEVEYTHFGISIHALREEGDADRYHDLVTEMLISIHALREEGDRVLLFIAFCVAQFLSTPSARRATGDAVQALLHAVISIHALREEGDSARVNVRCVYYIFLSTPSARRATYTSASHWRDIDISIHALREEGDFLPVYAVLAKYKFLSTPSARRATSEFIFATLPICDFYPRPPRGGRHVYAMLCRCFFGISIHALREEGDYAM